MEIYVIEKQRTLEMLAEVFTEAARTGRSVRVAVDGGFKVDAGGVTGGWTPPYGRAADATGH